MFCLLRFFPLPSCLFQCNRLRKAIWCENAWVAESIITTAKPLCFITFCSEWLCIVFEQILTQCMHNEHHTNNIMQPEKIWNRETKMIRNTYLCVCIVFEMENPLLSRQTNQILSLHGGNTKSKKRYNKTIWSSEG